MRRRIQQTNPALARSAAEGAKEINETLMTITGFHFKGQFSELAHSLAFACADRIKPSNDPTEWVTEQLRRANFVGVILNADSIVECTPNVTVPVLSSRELMQFQINSLSGVNNFTAAYIARGEPTGFTLYLFGAKECVSS